MGRYFTYRPPWSRARRKLVRRLRFIVPSPAGPSASVTGVATVSATAGLLLSSADAAVTGVGSVTADANVTYSGEASVSGIATVSAEGRVVREVPVSVIDAYAALGPGIRAGAAFQPAVRASAKIGVN